MKSIANGRALPFTAISLSMISGIVVACAGARPFVPAPPTQAASSPPSHDAPACGRERSPTCVSPPPGYASEIQPIFERRCYRCHAGDGAAAEEHDFSRFDDVHAQASLIADAVAACAMPPKSSAQLDAAEADTLLRWIACGAPR